MKGSRIAAVVTGTAREVEFILDLMPHLLSNDHQVDTFLVLEWGDACGDAGKCPLRRVRAVTDWLLTICQRLGITNE